MTPISRRLPLLLGVAAAATGLAAAVLFIPLSAPGERVAGAPSASPSPTPTPSSAATPEIARSASPSLAPAAPATPAPSVGIDVGNLAPDFALEALDGRTVRLSNFRGQPVWINFWAPWCIACRTEMPRIEGKYQEHRSDGLVVLGVGIQESREAIAAFADEVGATYPIVVDGDGRVAAQYSALALPVSYWIDRGGIVREWVFGELSPDLMAASLERILVP